MTDKVLWFRSTQKFCNESAVPYLATLVVAVSLSHLVRYLAPYSPTLSGQPLAVLVQFGFFAITVVLWWTYKSPLPSSRLLTAFFVLLGLTSFTFSALTLLDSSGLNPTSFLVIPSLLLVWRKPPTFRAAIRVTDIFSWFLIFMALISQILDISRIKPIHVEFGMPWTLLKSVFGVEYRWEGPFGHVNFAGTIGAFLLVYGLSRSRWTRVAFLAFGLAILLMSGSRTALLGAAVGIGVMFAFSQQIGKFTTPRWLRIIAPSAVLAGTMSFFVLRDPDLDLRVPIWHVYISLWKDSPVLGLGDSGFAQAIQNNLLQSWVTQAHSIYFDTLTRYGIVGLVFLLATLILAAMIAVRAGIKGLPVGVAVLSAFLTIGLAETFVDWRYISIQSLPMMLATLLSAAWIGERGPASEIHDRHGR